MMKKLYVFGLWMFAVCAGLSARPMVAQQVALAGLRSAGTQGQFNGVATDANGNIFLVMDEKDGVRVLKTDAGGANVLAQAHLGAAGDIGLAVALDPSGNVYVTGTTTSGALNGTGGSAFPNSSGSSTNSFVVKFDNSLNELWLTFGGSGRMAAASVAATGDAVFVAGSIFAATLPVTSGGVIQSPAPGSSANGFVEKFSASGSTLLYATYLSGANGNTAAVTIAADAADDAYVAGTTSATGYPTVSALVPSILLRAGSTNSGFVTKLSPLGDGILFSTFVPGDGVSSVRLDAAGGSLLVAGSVALGQFPVATVMGPVVNSGYQALLRLRLDGSGVISSTLLAPGTQSFVVGAAGGSVWVDGGMTGALLPFPALENFGNSFALHVASGGAVDAAFRFGGLSVGNPSYASAPVTVAAVGVDASGNGLVAGSFAPTASSGLLGTQRFDPPLVAVPNGALPSTVRSAVPAVGSCNGSLCSGSAAYLAKAVAGSSAPVFPFSIDDLPNITLRNLGAGAATGVQVSATGYTVATNCGQTLGAGGECSVALTGAGPGSITATATNAATYTVALSANAVAASAIVFLPKELDFGVQSALSAAGTRVITVSNLGTQSASFNSAVVGTAPAGASFFESVSDCTTGSVATTKVLAPGGSCHITIGFTASSTSANDGFVQAEWAIGGGDVLLTGYQQAEAVTLSASEVDFGTQFVNGLRLPRFLYVSNGSDHAVSHAAATLPAGSAFTVADNCPAVLDPRTVCQLRIDYLSATAPSTDSQLLVVDGASVLLTGETLPQPTAGGASANPNLSVTPTSVVFANAVVVTGVSSNTQTVVVKNTGATAFTLGLALTGDFTDTTNCGATLTAGASCSVVVSFTPSQPGVRDGLLAVTAGGGGPVYVALTGTGTAIVPLNDGTIDFGEVPLNVPKVIWLKVGPSFPKLTVSVGTASYGVVLVEDAGYGHGAPSRLAFTGTATGTCFNCWIGVQFLPTVAGVQNDSLMVSSIAGGKAYVLALTGTGVAETGVFWTPVSEDFGPVTVNSSTNAMLFMLTNETAGVVTVGAPAVTGNFAIVSGTGGGRACAGQLAATASCFVSVVFAPAAVGARAGVLSSVTSFGVVTAALVGEGVPDPGLAINPDALVFANVPGSAATQQTVTLSNTGGVVLQVGAVGATSPAFAVSSNCGTVGLGAMCSVTVTFTPQSSTVSAVLNVPVTFVVGGVVQSANYVVPLTGAYTTEDAGIAIVPGQVNYGASAVDVAGPVRTFTIDNLTAKSLTVTLDVPRQFALVGGGCGGLAPFASCTVAVGFVPLTSGDVTGTLFVQANPSDNSGTLNGIGYVEGYGVSAKTVAVTGNILPPGILAFGQVTSGQTSQQVLTVTNNNKVAGTTITVRRVTSEWPFLSTTDCIATLAVGQSCHVTVTYSPLNQQAVGGPVGATNDVGVLMIESDAVTSPELIDLTGSAAPVFVAAPGNGAPLVAYTVSAGSLTFAATQVGSVSAAQTVTLSNTGTATINIFAAQAPADYVVTNGCNAPLIPGASCAIGVALSPKSTAVLPGALEILSDASTSLEFVSLIGLGTPAQLVLSPASLDFGTVVAGSSSRLGVQVTNTGATPVTIFNTSASGDYSAAGSCPASGGVLAANTSCTVQVTFAPTQVGTRTGTLSIASSATAVPLTVPLTGVGVQARLVIAPTALNFGSIALGASANLTVTLTNAGTADVTGIATAITGDYQVTTPCVVTALAPGAGCQMVVTFTPTALGARPGTLTITSSDPGSPAVIPLSGTGIVAASFTLTVTTGSSATQTVISGRPATFTLTLTPVNGFSGTVVLNCTPLTTPAAAFCSLLPSSVTLAGSPQDVVATINTVYSVTQARVEGLGNFGGRMLCLLVLPIVVAAGRGRVRFRLLLWMVGFAGIAAGVSGCGAGGDPYLRYTPPGTYQFQVTASSTSGVQITQSVTLTLVVNPR